MTPEELLANAIVEQAVKDYRQALKDIKRASKAAAARESIQELEDFFHSDWYALLTTLDPDVLINRLRKEAVK